MTQKSSEPEWLFHYTNHSAFYSIIRSNEFWAHDYRLANDRREISYAAGLIRRSLEEKWPKKYQSTLRDIVSVFADPFSPFELRDMNEYITIASFSEEENQLSQWRAYAPDSGYSLGFEREALFSLACAQGFEVGPVIYNFNKQNSFIKTQLREFLDEELMRRLANVGDPLGLVERFAVFYSGITPLIKHESFYEEREWRIFRTVPKNEIQFYAGKLSIRPYIPIKLAEPSELITCLRAVRIGPADDQHALRDWTIDFLRNHGYALDMERKGKGVVVTVSGSPYRLTQR